MAIDILTEMATLRQPMPVDNGGDPVTSALIAELDRPDPADRDICGALSGRAEIGLLRYDSLLMTRNGRNPRVDLVQELLDAMQYAYQVRMESNDPTEQAEMMEMIDTCVVWLHWIRRRER